MKLLLIIFTIALNCPIAKSQGLKVINQNYSEALKIASQENKLIFIDFYTTWCAPCKKLDKLIFENDSIGNSIKKNFVFLKYDAEKDTVYNLSKKHHISSYPTGLILNKDGFVINRRFGFSGNDFNTLSENVNKFTIEAIELNNENKHIKGYSNVVDISKYPDFYIKYINRQKLNIDSTEFLNYWKNNKDYLSEEYFATLMYFGTSTPNFVSDLAELNKNKYEQLFGIPETEILFYMLSNSKMNYAVATKNKNDYEKAVDYTKRNLSEKWTKTMIPNFEIDFLKSQKMWNEVYKIRDKSKEEGKLDYDDINSFCYEAYMECEDKKVLSKFANWMKEVTKKEPTYAYLDTYAFLLFKADRKLEAKKIANLAVGAAKKENKKTKDLEELLQKL